MLEVALRLLAGMALTSISHGYQSLSATTEPASAFFRPAQCYYRCWVSCASVFTDNRVYPAGTVPKARAPPMSQCSVSSINVAGTGDMMARDGITFSIVVELEADVLSRRSTSSTIVPVLAQPAPLGAGELGDYLAEFH